MKKIILALATLFSIAFLATPSLVFAQAAPNANPDAKSAVCDGLGQLSGGQNNSCDASASNQTDLTSTIKLAINLLSFAVGIAAVIMVILGGFKYVTSGGDSARVNSAKDTILYALAGLVVALMAQAIVRFVLGKSIGSQQPKKTTSLRLVVKPLADDNRDMV